MRRGLERAGPVLLIAALAVVFLVQAWPRPAPVNGPVSEPPAKPTAPTATAPPAAARAGLERVALPPPPSRRNAARLSAPARPSLQPSAPQPVRSTPPARKRLQPADTRPKPVQERRFEALRPIEPAPVRPVRSVLKPARANAPAPERMERRQPLKPTELTKLPDPIPEERALPTADHVAAPDETETAPDEPETVPVRDPAALRQGRVLLRVLEHGKGPDIRIAWPAGARDQDRLYRRLVACHGMRIALMDGDGRLFADDGAPGKPWAINLDRYSGFIRQADGRLAGAEVEIARAIRRRHTLSGPAVLIRVFPRDVDAVVLGGLKAALAGSYDGASRIHGAYRLDGLRLFIDRLDVDGRSLSHRIEVLPWKGGRCA